MSTLLAAFLASVVLGEERFSVSGPGVSVVRMEAACVGCSWERSTATGAFLVLEVDGMYSRHLVLTRDETPLPEYLVSLGPLAPGSHELVVRREPGHPSEARTGAVRLGRLAVETIPEGSDRHLALALAPVFHPRPDALSSFTDIPLVMWYETDITPRGRRLRYSVVFSHEDGGTPADRLMATWGRLTDIEFVLGVEVSPEGRVLGAEIQGKDHRIVPFTYPAKGPPHLFVVTDNNMLAPQGTTDPVYALVPVEFPLSGTSREAVMDAFPWTYAVSSREAIRQGHVSQEARPGSRKVPDPRRFLYVEACAETKDATLAFSVGVGRREPLVWADSDEGGPSFRIQRRADQFPNGCFRGAVALADGLPLGETPRLRFRAFTRPLGKGEPALPRDGSRAQLRSVTRVFHLDSSYRPVVLPLEWKGEIDLVVDGPAAEVPLKAP